MTAMAHHAAVSGGQRAVLGAARGDGGLDEGRAQPAIAFACPSRLVLAGTLVIARADADPAGHMPLAREETHIHAELGDDHFGCPFTDPGDRVQPRQLRCERGQSTFDFRTDLTDGPRRGSRSVPTA